MKTKKLPVILVVFTLLLIVTVPGAFAFFTVKDSFEDNVGSSKYGGASIIKDDYDSLEDADGNGIKDVMENLTALSEIPMDPKIHSDGNVDSWAILKVSIPTVESTLKDTDDDKTVHDVFTYTLNDGWVLLGSDVSESTDTQSVYYYGYTTILTAGSDTSTAFDTISVQDFSKNEEITNGQIDFDAALVQAANYSTIRMAFDAIGTF